MFVCLPLEFSAVVSGGGGGGIAYFALFGAVVFVGTCVVVLLTIETLSPMRLHNLPIIPTVAVLNEHPRGKKRIPWLGKGFVV